MKTIDFNISFSIHDVKNYIGAAISHLQLASIEHDNIEDNHNISASIDSLWLALHSAREIAENGSTIESGELASGYVLVSVNEHVTGNTQPFIVSVRKIYPEVDINFSYSPKEEKKYIEVHAKSFNQAMGNIIGNAVNAGASKIDIHIVMRAYCVVITIHDNGRGMSSEDVDKIMLSQFGDGKAHGVGTKSILITAADHDFPLTYTSVEGEGTTIKILMPYINP